MATPSVSIAAHVLVIDDEPDLRTLYELTLLREGYRVETAGSVSEALNALGQHDFDVVISDMRLPDGMGTEVLAHIKQQGRSERCVVITAYGSAENAVSAFKAGAFDYLTKPVDLKQFRTVIRSAVLDAPPATIHPPIASNAHAANAAVRTVSANTALERLVGESPSICAVRERVAKIARSMAPVLICGESGTGKELVAQAIHANSHRANGPWVAVNCGAIPENLLETEFFGAKKGAFTGALHDRAGFFQTASGGTLFLDEIGDLPLAMQSKLLRAIQERCVRPIGSPHEEPVDVRIVSATHKDLAAEVTDGRFRQDLFYRLNVIDIFVTPLRERSQDLPALCHAILKRICAESQTPVPVVSEGSLIQLAQCDLRGNVRELENLLHRAIALSDGGELNIDCPKVGRAVEQPTPNPDPTPLPSKDSTRIDIPQDLQTHLDNQEREILIRVLNDAGFNRTTAANRLGLTLRQIRYRIARLNIRTPHADDAGSD